MKGFTLMAIFSAFFLSLAISTAMGGDETVSHKQTTVNVTENERFMRQAFDLAISSGKKGDHTFGAVLVYQGKVVMTAENTVNTDDDISRHAETNLLIMAKRKLSPEVIRESTLYASTEPCTFCCAVMYYVGIKSVVYGVSSMALQKLTGWRDEGLSCDELYRRKGKKLDATGPILENEGLEVFRYMP